MMRTACLDKRIVILVATLCAVVLVAQRAGAASQTVLGPGDNKNTVRGAVYIPARAYNAPQMWKEYSPRETRRDMGYAKQIRLNALRVWASYEYWRIERDHFKRSFDDFLDAAEEYGLRIYPSLFENCGVPPTEESMWSKDAETTVCVNSPHKEKIGAHPERWNETAEYVKWFMKHYKNDTRLIAIEIMNEPRGHMVGFTRAMLEIAAARRGSVPLTVGTSRAELSDAFLDLGIDIIQFHNNFPTSKEASTAKIETAIEYGKTHGLPVWMAEWQRLRPSGAGFKQGQKMTEEEKYSNYSTMAADIQRYEMGTFFWSLMVKRAYLAGQRANGTVNGLFWEDGSVWSIDDARAISNIADLELTESRDLGKLPK